jgi:hypothetical protein
MAISVICPGCHKRFKVSDQFAGQTGACPQCKGKITVPAKSDEVEVHAPDAFADGGRSVDGKLVTKPISRSVTKFNPVVALIIAAVALCVLILTWACGGFIRGSIVVQAVGLLLVSPPLVFAGYTFLRDVELEPYRGKALYIRSIACGVAWAALWGVFAFLDAEGLVGEEIWTWLIIGVPLMVVGGMISSASLDLDFGNGCLHYTFYLAVTMTLRWAAGMPWIWDLPGK